MKIKHLSLARFTTNLTLLFFVLFALGFVLWMSDEFLKWNILPDWIDKYAELLILIFGFFAFLLVVSSFLCHFMVIAEFAAHKMGLTSQEEAFLTRQKVIILAVLLIISLSLFFTFHKIDKYREANRLDEIRVEFKGKLDERSEILTQALSEIVALFPETLLQAMADKSILQQQDNHYIELTKLLGAIQASFPRTPDVYLLMLANLPYQYEKISVGGKRDYEHYNGYEKQKIQGYELYQQAFIRLQDKIEQEIVTALFQERIKPLDAVLEGQFLNNNNPSVWGLLKYKQQIVAIIFLEDILEGYHFENIRKDIFHPGPLKLISN